jgi:hypothetical protein
MEKLNDENLDLSLKHILNKDSYKTIFYGQHIMSSNNEYMYDYHTTIEHKNSCYIIHIYRKGKASRFYEEDKNKYHVTIKNQLNKNEISSVCFDESFEDVIKYIANKLYIFKSDSELDLTKELKDRYTNVFVGNHYKFFLAFVAQNKLITFVIKYEEREYRCDISYDGNNKAMLIFNNKAELINAIEERLRTFEYVTEGIKK